MKKSLKFISILASMLSLATVSFAQEWYEVGDVSVSTLDLTGGDDVFRAMGVSGKDNYSQGETFTIDKTINATDYVKFQFGGSGSDITQFTFNFTEGNSFEIASWTMANRPNSAVIDFTGNGTLKLSLETLPSMSIGTYDISDLTTTWNMYQSGGLTIAKTGITIANTNIVNVAKMNTIVNTVDNTETTDVDETTYAGLTLNGNAQFNIVDTQTTKTESVKLGDVTATGTSKFSMAVTGTGTTAESKINSLKAYDSASVSISAKGSDGYVNVYATSLGGTSSSGLLTAGTAKFKSIEWNGETKTGTLTYAGGHQGTSFTVGEGVTATINNSGSGLEGGFSFYNATDVTVNAHLYIYNSRALSVTGSEGSVKLSNTTITTKANASLVFNSTNVLKGTSANSTQKDIDFEIARNGTTMTLNADNDFGAVTLGSDSSKPNLKITLNGNSVSFENMYMNRDDSYIWFADFVGNDGKENGYISIETELASLNDNGALKNIFAGTLENRIDLYQWDDGSLHITTQVPEPAQWAVIFGAIALGFAMYRRRR